MEEGPSRRASGALVPPSLLASDAHAHHAAEEAESVTRTSEDQRQEKLAAFWSYIENMLINLDSLSLDRIFQMLKMFAFQAGECDIDELRAFLDTKVRQHALVFSAGQYKLPPKT